MEFNFINLSLMKQQEEKQEVNTLLLMIDYTLMDLHTALLIRDIDKQMEYKQELEDMRMKLIELKHYKAG